MAVTEVRLNQPGPSVSEDLPPLRNGDHLDQSTYHALYEAMPEDVHAELIGGIVFMGSPVSKPHKRHTNTVNWWLAQYEFGTPGTEALGDGTVILGPEDEPEPDVSLQVRPDHGGRTREENNYVVGAPELLAEVAYSSSAIDLHLKRQRYEIAGVDEYIVVLLDRTEVRWFVLQAGGYVPLESGKDGIFRSRRFPGLWLDPQALLRDDRKRLNDVLQQGLATPEHARWVEELAARKQHAG